MTALKAILFDLDGTLTDSALDLALAVNHMLEHLDMPRQPVESIYSYIGRGVRNMAKMALGIDNDEELEEAVNVFIDYYDAHCLDNTRLYPGVETVIEALDRYKLAVVTNKTRRFTDKILQGLGIESRFDVVLGGDDYPRLKPHPEPVLMACEMLGVEPAAAIMVGDSVPDIKSALSAGAMPCGVTYGLGKKEELQDAGARWTLDSIEQLPQLVISLES